MARIEPLVIMVAMMNLVEAEILHCLFTISFDSGATERSKRAGAEVEEDYFAESKLIASMISFLSSIWRNDSLWQ